MTSAATPRESLVRGALLWTFRRAIGIYFRRIEAAGNVPEPRTGGRVFVANHVNALVDPILVLTSAPCPISPIAKSTLWDIPGLRYLLDQVGAVPIVRRKDDPNKKAESNEAIFDRIAGWLAAQGNILIFPEGTSHNEPHLIPVKTGAARMLARAQSRGARGLTFQAVALEFDARTTFRSRCLLLYGPVREVDAFGSSGDELVAKVTSQLEGDLSELLVEGATWPERLLIARVAELFANDADDADAGGPGTMERWNSIGRRVEAAAKTLKGLDRETLARIEDVVGRYYAELEAAGLVDEQIAGSRAEPREGREGREGGERRAALVLGMIALLPLAVVGTVLYFLPYQLPRLVAKRAGDPDVVSTFKLGTGLVAYPLWASLLVAVAFARLPWPFAAAAVLVVLASPFAALAWHDRTPAIRRALRLWRKKARAEELRASRRRARRVVDETRAKLGL